MDSIGAAETLAQNNLDAAKVVTDAAFVKAAGEGEAARNVIDNTINAFKEDVGEQLDEAKAYTDNTIAPAIAEVKQSVTDLKSEVTNNVNSALTDVKKDVAALTAGLIGISQPFAADNCAHILKERSSAVAGEYYIKSSIDKAAIKVWCTKVGSKFISMGGDGRTKGSAAAGCNGSPILSNTNTNYVPWIDPDANAEDPSNSKQIDCGSGKTKDSAGLTCKGIRLSGKGTTNGLYWVIGRNEEYKTDPKQVYCWQTDRDGGGWTLVLVMYYRSHHQPSVTGNGVTTTGDIKKGDHWLTHLPGAYKMHDHEIRTVIGQSDYKNDNKNGKASMFSRMTDQSGYHSYYAGSNREYMIHKEYTARWRFYRFQVMPESTTTSKLTSYRWESNYNGNKNPKGDGTVNWEGNPICARGGAGVNCRDTRSGTPSSSLRGGRGCHRNIGHDRWHGSSYYYMMDTNHDTYIYYCNGPQHSSSNRFAHRQWLRTPDSDLVA
jgi:hypothetical protein